MDVTARIGSIAVRLKLTQDEWWPAHVITNTESLYQWIGDDVEAYPDVQSVEVGRETESGVIYKITFNDDVNGDLLSRASVLVEEVTRKCLAHYQEELNTNRIDT